MASAVPSRNAILVIGSAQVGKRFLVRRLVAPRSGSGSSDASAVAAHAVQPHSRIEAFHGALDTKYYSADVAFHVLPADAHAQLSESTEEEEEAGEERKAEAASATASSGAAAVDPVIPPLSADARAEFAVLAAEVQAVLLVFNLAEAASFHALASRWLPFIQQHNPSVLLCVGNERRNAAAVAAQTPAQRQEAEELEQLARDWALDNGLEYVSVPHNDALAGTRSSLGTASAAAPDELDAADEPVGLSRLLEALESNMWNHARMKERKTLQFSRGAERGGSDEHALDEEDEEEDEDEDAGHSAFADMAEEKQRTDAAAGTTAQASTDDDFSGFVSAFPFVAGGSQSAADGSATAAATSSATQVSQSAGVTASDKAKPASSGSAARSASASAFANAFARAISTDDAPKRKSAAGAAKPKPKAAPVAPASEAVPADLTAASAATSALAAPITPAELDALGAHLSAAARDAASSTDPAAGTDEDAAEHKLASDMASFDALFDKVQSIKAEVARAKDGASGLSDAERRKRAEDTVMRLLQSMGMEDEMDASDEDEQS